MLINVLKNYHYPKTFNRSIFYIALFRYIQNVVFLKVEIVLYYTCSKRHIDKAYEQNRKTTLHELKSNNKTMTRSISTVQ